MDKSKLGFSYRYANDVKQLIKVEYIILKIKSQQFLFIVLNFVAFVALTSQKSLKKVVAVKTATQFNDTSNYARRKRKKNWYLRMNMREGKYMHRNKKKIK